MNTIIVYRTPLLRKILTALYAISSITFVALLYVSGLVPQKYIIIGSIFLAIVCGLMTLWLLKHARKGFSRVLAYLVGLSFIVVIAYSSLAIYRGYQSLNQLTANNGQIVSYSVIVLDNSEITSIDQISDETLGGVTADTEYVKKIAADTKVDKTKYTDTSLQLVVQLYDKDHKVIVFNESFRDLVQSIYPKFKSDTRILKTYEFTLKSTEAKPLFNDKNAFNVYISGIDSYGPISTVSRSDVNIVATINPETKRILLTTIPRDSYVTIPLGGNDKKDKLTHAGNYGVETSQATIEQLLDIEIGAYMRVNFSTLIQLVDKIGGIDVDNPIAFRTDSGETFSAGVIHLNGKQALTFSRERHNLTGGDADRGVNQQRVLKAIFQKVASPSILTNYQTILNVVSKSVQTNIPSNDIAKFVNLQLDYGGMWQIDMQDIKGRGQTGGLPSYAMPGHQLYMVVLDPTSLQSAKNAIEQTMH